MRKKDNLNYVKKVIEYCDIVNELLNEYGNDYLIFQSSKSFQLSTSMCIIQIGEYVNRIDENYREEHDFIPWKKIRGMRNIATHQYDKFDFKILWYTLTVEIPELREQLLSLI